jgi:phospholipase C
MAASDIEHVVVLMMENRSFDHVFGYLDLPNIDGLRGGGDYGSTPVSGTALVRPRPTTGIDDDYVTCPDPGHEMQDTTQQIFDLGPAQVCNGVPLDPTAKPTMRGFVRSYAQQKPNGCRGNWQPEDIMRCFLPQHVPVLTALARNYVLVDRWFCAIPGPTWPNRFWSHAATAMGHGEMSDAYIRQCLLDSPFTAQTIFNRLDAHADDWLGSPAWRVYYHQTPQASTLQSIAERLHDPDYFRPFEANEKFWSDAPLDGFEADCGNGDLPYYTFIEPQFDSFAPLRAVTTDNSMHPPADVRDGERLIARVYNAIRGNADLWAKTVLVVTYDEHGGFYDHVVPPRVPSQKPDAPASPRDANGQPLFLFDRLGPRVPTLIVSPWVKKGVIDHGPGTGAHIDPAIHYDHSSIVATVRELVGRPVDPLTERDEIATTFTHLFGDSKRGDGDCPDKLGSEWGVE